MSNWEHIAVCLQNSYGAYVDWLERFYICPECGEPIYEEDWADDDFEEDILCPICFYAGE